MKTKSEMPSDAAKREPGVQLLLILLILLPLIILFLLPGGRMLHGGMFFWMGLLLCFWLISMLFGAGADISPVPPPGLLTAEDQPVVVKDAPMARLRCFRTRYGVPRVSTALTCNRNAN